MTTEALNQRDKTPMRSKIIAIILGVALAAGTVARASAASAQIANLPDLVASLLPQVVNITMTGGAKREVGSGFVIDPAGIILTNRHVADGGTDYVVVLDDHTRLRATLLFRAPGIDLAMLQVHPGRPLPAVRWGNSDTMRPGDGVIAIGNPLGLGSTVTTGIVSALNRDIKETKVDEFIQVDAPLNPGNSGGPLFNAAGEVVGVNTALFTVGGEGGSIGLGFSIPGNDAKFIVAQLLKTGTVKLGSIEGTMQDITPEMAQAMALPAPLGVVVAAVPAGNAARDADLQIGDVITKFGDSMVDYLRNFNRMVATAPIETTVPTTVLRNGTPVTVSLKINEQPPNKDWSLIKPIAPPQPHTERSDFGLSGGPIDDAARKKYNIDKDVTGVLVTAVVPGSLGSDYGFAVGNVVERVQNTAVNGVDDIVKIVSQARKDGKTYIMALVWDPKGPRWMAVPIQPAS